MTLKDNSFRNHIRDALLPHNRPLELYKVVYFVAELVEKLVDKGVLDKGGVDSFIEESL